MADVTQEMILDYLVRKGGVVKNVDLVKHFRKHLQAGDPKMKDRAREAFKERVNAVAYIKAEHGEKYLHLRSDYKFRLSTPPAGKTPNGQRASPRTSVVSIDSQSSKSSPVRKSSKPYDDPFAPIVKSSPRSSLVNDFQSPSRPPTVQPSAVKDDPFAPRPPPQNDSLMSGYLPSSRPSPPRQTSSSIDDPFAPRPAPQSNSLMSDFLSSKPSPPKQTSIIDDPFAPISPPKRDSLKNNVKSSRPSPPRQISSYKEPTSNDVAGLTSPKHAPALSSYKPLSSSPPLSSSIFSSPTSKTGPQTSMSMDLGGIGDSMLGDFDSMFKGSSTLGDSRATNTSTQATTISSTTVQANSTTSSTGPANSVPTTGSNVESRINPTLVKQNTVPSPRSTSYGPLKSQSSLAAPPEGKTENRLSSGYGSLGKTSGIVTAEKASTTTKPATSKPTTSSLLDDFSSIFSTLDASLDEMTNNSYSSTLANNSTVSDSPKSPSNTGKSSPPSVTKSSTTNSLQYISTAKDLTSSPELSYNGPSLKPVSSPSYSPNKPSGQRSPLRVAPKPVRDPLTSDSSSSSLTNGNTEAKQVSNRRPPPGPSPTPKRPAPKPPTRSSSIHKHSPQSSSTLDRKPSNVTSSSNYGTSTQSLPRHSRHANTTAEEQKGQMDLDILSSLSSFNSSTVTGGSDVKSSLTTQSAPAQAPSNPRPPLVSQGALTDSTELPSSSLHTQARHTSSSDSGGSRPRAPTDENPPFIRVDSPTKHSDASSSPRSVRGRSPPYSNIGAKPLSSNGSFERLPKAHHDSNERISSHPGVVLRNRAQSNASHSSNRRSRNLEKNSNLDNKTRQMIIGTPPTSRRASRLAPPEVAPKPANHHKEVQPARSREDMSQYGDEEGSNSVVGNSEPDYWDIDPYEKEWMLASAEANMETIHRLFMTEPSLVNRKDFLHGYTAMHWAAKHGRIDLISALAMNGGRVNIKSNGGLTPLHLAATSGHDNAIIFLVKECNADVNTRDHGGRRAMDMIHPKCSQESQNVLSKVNNHGLPPPARPVGGQLPSFTRPRSTVTLHRTWSSSGDIDKRHSTDPMKRKNSPKSVRKSFSFKKNRISRDPTSPTRKDKKKSHISKKDIKMRPVSDAHAYTLAPPSYDV